MRDLLTMCLGQARGELMGAQRPLYQERDWVKLALSFPFTDAPNTKFVYNNVGPYLAGMLVQRRSGCDLVSYLTPRLFEHLGITRPTWETDPLGHTFGAGGLFLTLSELHTFGQFYLQNGRWKGRQLLDPAWVKASTSKQVEYAHTVRYLFWAGSRHLPADANTASSPFCAGRRTRSSRGGGVPGGSALNRAIFDELYPQL